MNSRFSAEVQLLADLIVTDFARVTIDTDRCLCPPALCGHEPVFKLFMCDINEEEHWVDFIDSETVREADRLASSLRRSK